MKEETMWICPNIISLEEATKTYPVCVGGWCVLKKKKKRKKVHTDRNKTFRVLTNDTTLLN